MKYAEAEVLVDELIDKFLPVTRGISVAGSVRRKVAEPNDIELVAMLDPKQLVKWVDLVSGLQVTKGNARGRYIQFTYKLKQIDLFLTQPDNFGLILATRTGSASFSHFYLAGGWVAAGYRCVDGMLRGPAGKVSVREEEDLFTLIDKPWVDPEKRT